MIGIISQVFKRFHGDGWFVYFCMFVFTESTTFGKNYVLAKKKPPKTAIDTNLQRLFIPLDRFVYAKAAIFV